MNQHTEPQDIEKRVEAILHDRQALKRILPRVIAKAEQTYPPSILQAIGWHHIALDEARLYDAGLGQAQISRLREGRKRQNTNQAILGLVRRMLLGYPELLEEGE